MIRKTSLILKFLTPKPGKKTIGIQILRNISRSKESQTMKLGQLVEQEKHFS